MQQPRVVFTRRPARGVAGASSGIQMRVSRRGNRRSNEAGNKIMEANRLRIQAFEDPNKLFVGNLAWNTTKQELQAFCETIGPVSHVKIVKNRYTGLPKGYAFVRYCMPISATSALDILNDAELNGRLVRVKSVMEGNDLSGGDEGAAMDGGHLSGEDQRPTSTQVDGG
eukprot:FR738980.1.p1 GENE.FR738980.1~~FR738980.1.p1  ORF type:complete len:196 (+),score=8.80 FR738980.1:84-590(+)